MTPRTILTVVAVAAAALPAVACTPDQSAPTTTTIEQLGEPPLDTTTSTEYLNEPPLAP